MFKLSVVIAFCFAQAFLADAGTSEQLRYKSFKDCFL